MSSTQFIAILMATVWKDKPFTAISLETEITGADISRMIHGKAECGHLSLTRIMTAYQGNPVVMAAANEYKRASFKMPAPVM